MIKVITPPVAEPITLEEAKAHLRVVFDDEDAQISMMIAAARGMLETRTNRLLMAQTIEFASTLWGFGLRVPVAPFRQLVGVTYTDATGATQSIDLADLAVDSFVEPAIVGLPYGGVWPEAQPGSPRVVRVQVGYADAASVPSQLKMWMKMAIAAMYENREALTAGVTVQPLPQDFMSWLWHPYMVYV